MKRVLLLLLAGSALAACSDAIPTLPPDSRGGEMSSGARPPGPPGPPHGPPAGSGTLHGRKFHDLDADGTDEGGGDPGLAGWTIQVYADDDKDGIRDASELAAGPVERTVTNAAGAYELTLRAGRYVVCEVLQAGWIQSSPANGVCAPDPAAAHGGRAVTVTAGSALTGNDFGNYQHGNVTGRVFHDIDGDGTDDGGTDPGLEDWQIFAYRDANGNGVLDAAEFDLGPQGQDRTDPEYNDLDLTPGTYIVCEVLKEGWAQSAPANTICAAGAGYPLAAGGHVVTVTSGSFENGNDFGNVPLPPGSVRGRKFADLDADGTDEGGGDAGLSGWTIEAYQDIDRNGVLDDDEVSDGAAATVVTDASGLYELTLAPGKYVVCEVLQNGWQQTAPGNTACAARPGSDFPLAPGGHAITVTSGIGEGGKDFGNFQGAAPLPDLIVQAIAFTAPENSPPHSYTVTVKNMGGATANLSGALLQGYYSSDKVIDNNDGGACGVIMSGSLAPGATIDVVVGCSAAPPPPPGEGYLLVHVDITGVVAESDETNNVGAVISP